MSTDLSPIVRAIAAIALAGGGVASRSAEDAIPPRTEERASPPAPRPLWMSAPETQAFLERTKALSRRLMDASTAELDDPSAYHLAKLTTREAVRKKRAVLEAYCDAWTQWSESLAHREEELEKELERQRVSPERRAEIMASYRALKNFGVKARSTEPQGPPLETYFAQRRELLDFAETHLGAWRIDAEGRVVFATDEVKQKYLDIARRMREFAERSAEAAAAVEARADAARERLRKKQGMPASGADAPPRPPAAPPPR